MDRKGDQKQVETRERSNRITHRILLGFQNRLSCCCSEHILHSWNPRNQSDMGRHLRPIHKPVVPFHVN